MRRVFGKPYGKNQSTTGISGKTPQNPMGKNKEKLHDIQSPMLLDPLRQTQSLSLITP